MVVRNVLITSDIASKNLCRCEIIIVQIEGICVQDDDTNVFSESLPGRNVT